MNSIDHYFVFLLSGIILNITPGPDTLYILSISIAQGRRAGIMSILGISTGGLVHTFLVAFGLSLIITKSIVAFTIIKYIGAGYLIFIGVKTIIQKYNPIDGTLKLNSEKKLFQIYRQGLITNLFNPKVAMFFISFLPQFVPQGAGNGPIPFLILGITFIITGTIWCLIVAFSASFLSTRLRQNRKISFVLQKTCGAIFVGLGLKLAFVRLSH